MEEYTPRSQWTNCTVVLGEAAFTDSTAGAALDSSRPRRKIVDGLDAARNRAVWTPRPPGVGPVITTRNVRE